MKRTINGKIIAIVALTVAVICLSVGFSALASQLKVRGNIYVNTQWGVEFTGRIVESLQGEARSYEMPELSATAVSDYRVSLSEPGDSVTYTFDIENTGKIDAKISNIQKDKMVCSGYGETPEADASKMCANLSYTFTYTSSGRNVAVGDTLLAGQKENVTLKLEYKANTSSSDTPNNDVKITGLGITIIYVQK